jgi:hypothetical protein
MTKDKDFKKVVRARSAKTGESYSTARSHLVNSPDEASRPSEASSRDDARFEPEPGSLLAQFRAEDERNARREIDDRRIRVERDDTGRWVARSDEYPNLVGRGSTELDAAIFLIAEIGEANASWHDYVDDDSIAYIENQDD